MLLMLVNYSDEFANQLSTISRCFVFPYEPLITAKCGLNDTEWKFILVVYWTDELSKENGL